MTNKKMTKKYKTKETGEEASYDEIKRLYQEIQGNTDEYQDYSLEDFIEEEYVEVED